MMFGGVINLSPVLREPGGEILFLETIYTLHTAEAEEMQYSQSLAI